MDLTTLFLADSIMKKAVSMVPPLSDVSTKTWYNFLPTKNPNEGLIISAAQKGIISPEQFIDWMRELGYRSKFTDIIWNSAINSLPYNSAIKSFWRGDISVDTLYKKLAAGGFCDYADAEVLVKSMKYIPSIGDAVDLAHKRLLGSELSNALSLSLNLPSEYTTLCGKNGCDKEYAENLYQAGWRVPSISELCDLMHRGFVDEITVRNWMSYSGIHPYLKDPLIKGSYQPISIRYIRQLAKEGLLEPHEISARLGMLGYTKEDAAIIAQYMDLLESPEDKGLSREGIIKAFKLELITESEMRALFKIIDYSDKVIEFWVKIANNDNEKEELQEKIEHINYLYNTSQISEIELQQRLLQLGMTSNQAMSLVEKYGKAKLQTRKLPSIDDLKRWYKKGVITQNIFSVKMKTLGFIQEDINFYIDEHNFDINAAQVKDENQD